ncbi:MAG: hypothetical protein WD554_07845 [Flavobacteriaceae bacterium]
MDILAKLDEIDAFTDLINEKSDLIRKELSKKEKANNKINTVSRDLVARALAKRAKSRISFNHIKAK